MLIISRSPSSPKIKAPFRWGDVVKVDNDTTEIIYMPDTTFKESETFIISQKKDKYGNVPRAIRGWHQMKFISSYKDVTDYEVRKLMEPYRKCICLNVSKWTIGVDFFGRDKDVIIDFLKGNKQLEEDIPAGSLSLLRKFWQARINDWRVMIHRKDDWCHWFMFGPFASESKAREAFNEKSREALALPPKFIKHGIYRNDGRINCISLYKGPYLVARHSLLIGQGGRIEIQ